MLREINFVMTPPTVSMPRVRGVTSNLGFEGPGMPVTGVEMLRKCQKKRMKAMNSKTVRVWLIGLGMADWISWKSMTIYLRCEQPLFLGTGNWDLSNPEPPLDPSFCGFIPLSLLTSLPITKEDENQVLRPNLGHDGKTCRFCRAKCELWLFQTPTDSPCTPVGLETKKNVLQKTTKEAAEIPILEKLQVGKILVWSCVRPFPTVPIFLND